MKNKKCKDCGVTKPATPEYFHRDKHLKGGLRAQCKDCKNVYQKSLAGLADKLKYRYGITLGHYDQMFEEQNGVCAICSQPETHSTHNTGIDRLCVDHNHKTGEVRGLLCRKCNIVLGNAEDDINILASAMKYLKENN